jgi:predicted small lipoprotein YifL
MQRYNLMIKTRVIVLILMTMMVAACGRKGPLHLPVQKPEKTKQTQTVPDNIEKKQKQESR